MKSAWREDFLSLTWSDFTSQVFNLSQSIQQRELKIDLIVTIARGGLTVSQLLSDFLSLPIASFTIQSYQDLQKQKEAQITYGLGAKLENKTVLLVDDVADSGKTFHRGIEYLVEMGATKECIHTAAIHYKPHSIYKPDFFVTETAKWIVYPYEVRETIQNVGKMWKKEGITPNEITNRFQTFGFDLHLIKKFLS